MRIEAYTQVQQMYNTKKAGKTEKPSAGSFRDQLEISSTGKDIQVAKQAVSEASDIRTELTEPIKQKIQNGTYQVSTEDFAQKLIDKYDEMR